MKARVRIVGLGNVDRGDDAAGLLVARRLQELAVKSEECSDPLSLIESWADAEELIIVDAVVTGARPGTILSREVDHDRLSAFEGRETSTHGFGLTQAVELGRSLNRLPRRIRIYGIEGQSFEIGALPSLKVLAAVESLAQQLARAHSHCEH